MTHPITSAAEIRAALGDAVTLRTVTNRFFQGKLQALYLHSNNRKTLLFSTQLVSGDILSILMKAVYVSDGSAFVREGPVNAWN